MCIKKPKTLKGEFNPKFDLVREVFTIYRPAQSPVHSEVHSLSLNHLLTYTLRNQIHDY